MDLRSSPGRRVAGDSVYAGLRRAAPAVVAPIAVPFAAEPAASASAVLPPKRRDVMTQLGASIRRVFGQV